MISAFDGKMPRVAGSAFVSERACVIGDVEIGENSGVWPGAVIRGDFGPIRIGRNSHIEDNSVVHAGTDLYIGDNVLIGHSVVVHCRKVGDNVLIGNNATILDDAEIGDCCIIGANSMVSVGQKIPAGSFVVGSPARVKRQLSPQEMAKARVRTQGYSELARRFKEQGL